VQIGTAIGATSVPHHLARKPSIHAPSSNSNLQFDPAFFLSGALPVLRFQLSESQLFQVFSLLTLDFPPPLFHRTMARLFVMGGIGVQLPTGWQVSLLGRQAPVTPVVQLQSRNSHRLQPTLSFP
jgi:hypothetical protein